MREIQDALSLMKRVQREIDSICADSEVAKATIRCMINSMCTLCDELGALDTRVNVQNRKNQNKLLKELSQGDNEQLNMAREVLRTLHK